MISLPSKPWKRVRIEPVDDKVYLIILLTDMPDKAAFLDVIEKDIRPCISGNDTLDRVDWDSRSAVLVTDDLTTFKRNMVYACVMIEMK